MAFLTHKTPEIVFTQALRNKRKLLKIDKTMIILELCIIGKYLALAFTYETFGIYALATTMFLKRYVLRGNTNQTQFFNFHSEYKVAVSTTQQRC